MLLLSFIIIFFINVIAKVNKEFDEKIDIVSGMFIWIFVSIIISLYNGIDLSQEYFYNFQEMKSFNTLLLICIISSLFYKSNFDPMTAFQSICLFTLILFYPYVLSLEVYARIIILLTAVSLIIESIFLSGKALLK
jgi:hypothetical protein